ncbi:MAG: phosphatidylserine decarboxylase family protein [Bacteroidetes bacterium]|nr:MAG: phosphatidylserine decarboxylase family protein [Bacteroidota bacterium]PIE88049.1 MAG: phosphatidylserine decarboxylase family protein [Bacteroidota bacterium]
MKIHPKGFSTITLFSLVMLLFTSFLSTSLNLSYPYKLIPWGIMLILIIGFLLFFRNPQRELTVDPLSIISAADGKVVAIERRMEKEYFHEERLVIAVFMSIYDVHVNTVPIAGKVVYTKHHPGKNYPAINPKSSDLNERYTTVITSGQTSLLVRQIAGIAARRIHLSVTEGDTVKQGQELGIIKLGSRVDIYLPTEVEVVTKIGEQVTAGQSILARFPS